MNRSLVILDLEQRIKEAEEDLKALRHTLDWYLRQDGVSRTSIPVPTSNNKKQLKPETVSEGVERLLSEHAEMHIDEMLKQLQERWQIQMSKKNLANTLNRWLQRGRRFRRPRPNTYALLLEENE